VPAAAVGAQQLLCCSRTQRAADQSQHRAYAGIHSSPRAHARPQQR
jgi:hypothetical protein